MQPTDTLIDVRRCVINELESHIANGSGWLAGDEYTAAQKKRRLAALRAIISEIGRKIPAPARYRVGVFCTKKDGRSRWIGLTNGYSPTWDDFRGCFTVVAVTRQQAIKTAIAEAKKHPSTKDTDQ